MDGARARCSSDFAHLLVTFSTRPRKPNYSQNRKCTAVISMCYDVHIVQRVLLHRKHTSATTRELCSVPLTYTRPPLQVWFSVRRLALARHSDTDSHHAKRGTPSSLRPASSTGERACRARPEPRARRSPSGLTRAFVARPAAHRRSHDAGQGRAFVAGWRRELRPSAGPI